TVTAAGAGVYLLARFSWLIVMSPAASTIIAVTFGIVAVVAASIAVFQYDMQRIFAYTTMSQIGLVLIGAGTGAFAGALFRFAGHAFCMACLVLAAGSASRAVRVASRDAGSMRPGRDERDRENARDLRLVGGVRKSMPITAAAAAIGCMAMSVAGVP